MNLPISGKLIMGLAEERQALVAMDSLVNEGRGLDPELIWKLWLDSDLYRNVGASEWGTIATRTQS
jgi:hypothetical protein